MRWSGKRALPKFKGRQHNEAMEGLEHSIGESARAETAPDSFDALLPKLQETAGQWTNLGWVEVAQGNVMRGYVDPEEADSAEETLKGSGYTSEGEAPDTFPSPGAYTRAQMSEYSGNSQSDSVQFAVTEAEEI